MEIRIKGTDKIAYLLKNDSNYFLIKKESGEKDGPYLGKNFPVKKIDIETHFIEKQSFESGEHNNNGNFYLKENGQIRIDKQIKK